MRSSLNKNTAKLEKLYRLAETNNIPIDEHCPEQLISMSVRLPGGQKIIGISKGCENRRYTRLERIAHEMGHCMTDAFYEGYSPFEICAKEEKRADRWAVSKLVPFRSLCHAVKSGHRELWELADYFDVSEQFIEKAITVHAQNGNVVPPELYAEL